MPSTPAPEWSAALPSVPRRRLLAWLDQPVPLAILHGPAGAGKSDLLAQWMRSSSLPAMHFEGPASAQRLAAWLPAVQDSTPDAAPLTVVVDDIDDELPADVEERLFASLARLPALRVIISGRSTRGLEERAQRRRIRSTIRFGGILLATVEEATVIAGERGHGVDPWRIRELMDVTRGWWEPLRLILEESSPTSWEFGAATRWVENVALDGLGDDEFSFLARISLLDRIDADTLPLATAAGVSRPLVQNLIQSLQDTGALFRDGALTWSLIPIVRAVVDARIMALSADQAQTLHAAIADRAYRCGPRRHARLLLRHASRGHSWSLLERFWSEYGSEAMAEHPHDTRAAFAAVPDRVVTHSATLAVAVALSSGTEADDGVLGILGRYSDEHHELSAAATGDSTDAFVEATVIRILQLRRRGQHARAHSLSEEAQRELHRRLRAGAGSPTAAKSALLLIQHAVNHMLTENAGAEAAETARRALDFARSSGIDSLTTEVLGYLAVLRAAAGWSAPAWESRSRPTTSPSSKSGAGSIGSGHGVARAMAAVDNLDRERSEFALEQTQSHRDGEEIWPLAALAASRHALFFETSDVLDDHHRHLVWSHPTARDEPGTGRMIVDWSGVLADLRAGRLASAKRRIDDAQDESAWMSVLTARFHLSDLDHHAVLEITGHATTDDAIGNRERAQFLFMGAASALALGRERDAALLFRRGVPLRRRTACSRRFSPSRVLSVPSCSL